MRFFTEPCYARQALANSLIRVGESPVWVGAFNEWSTTFYYPMNGKTAVIRDIREVKKLNIEPVPLGYVNNVKTTSFLSRMPKRRWKQGLSPAVLSLNVSEFFLQSKALGNCILNRYPSFDKAYELIKEEKKLSCAFNREWALRVGVLDPDIMFRGTSVGIYTELGGVSLKPKYEYLTESFEEARK